MRCEPDNVYLGLSKEAEVKMFRSTYFSFTKFCNVFVFTLLKSISYIFIFLRYIEIQNYLLIPVVIITTTIRVEVYNMLYITVR